MTVMRPRGTGGEKRRLQKMEERGYGREGWIGNAKTHDSLWRGTEGGNEWGRRRTQGGYWWKDFWHNILSCSLLKHEVTVLAFTQTPSGISCEFGNMFRENNNASQLFSWEACTSFKQLLMYNSTVYICMNKLSSTCVHCFLIASGLVALTWHTSWWTVSKACWFVQFTWFADESTQTCTCDVLRHRLGFAYKFPVAAEDLEPRWKY